MTVHVHVLKYSLISENSNLMRSFLVGNIDAYITIYYYELTI